MSVQKRKPQVGSVDPFIDFQHEKMDTMDTLLEPYSAQEYIPSHTITPLIKLVFPSSTVLHSYSLEHLIVKVPIRELLSAPIMNWQYNRPADVPRCEDIAQYMVKSKKPVDTMIYISFNNKKKSFDVIDGIHRYTALTIIQEKTRHLDFLSSEFSGDMSWLIDSYILLNIRVNATEEELIGLFKALNKSNPIPDLYVRDVAKDKRQWIETLTARWQNRFKTHFSTTAKPNRPNVNRDRFMDLLNDVYDKHHLTEETKEKLEALLEKANVHISQNVPAKLTKAIREKCDLTGCWLFIYGTDDLVKMI